MILVYYDLGLVFSQEIWIAVGIFTPGVIFLI